MLRTKYPVAGKRRQILRLVPYLAAVALLLQKCFFQSLPPPGFSDEVEVLVQSLPPRGYDVDEVPFGIPKESKGKDVRSSARWMDTPLFPARVPFGIPLVF